MTANSYEVVVRGRLGPTLVSAFEGFDVTGVEHGCTHFVGLVIDQARLHSMIERLRDLNIELISLNRLPSLESRHRHDDGAGHPRD